MRYLRRLLLHTIVLHDHGTVRADDLVRAFLDWRNHFIAGLFEYIIDERIVCAARLFTLAASVVRYNPSICLIHVLLPFQTGTHTLL